MLFLSPQTTPELTLPDTSEMFSSLPFNFLWILIPFGIIFAIIITLVIVMLSKRAGGAKKPRIYKYNGHTLEIFIALTSIRVVYDGKTVDEYPIASGNTAGVVMREHLDGVDYKINIGNTGISPSVSVFANNEKLEPWRG